MPYNPNQKRDKNGMWTDDGIPNAIQRKIDKNIQEEKEIKSDEKEANGITAEMDVDEVMKMAKEVGPEVDKYAKEVAAAVGGTVTPINYKERDSIVRKVKKEYDGDITQLKDAARNTIVVNDLNSIEKAIKMFDNGKNRIKRQVPENFLGYSGIVVNFKTSTGMIAEVQINTPEMIYAKLSPSQSRQIIGETKFAEFQKKFKSPPGEGHKLYDIHRKLDLRDPKQKDYADEIEKKSKAYYDTFR